MAGSKMESNDESKQLLDKLNVFEEDIVNLLYHKKTRPFANFRNDRIFRLILHNSQFMEFAIQFANDFSPLAPDNPNDGAPSSSRLEDYPNYYPLDYLEIQTTDILAQDIDSPVRIEPDAY
jgi:hypothetical protein